MSMLLVVVLPAIRPILIFPSLCHSTLYLAKALRNAEQADMFDNEGNTNFAKDY